MKTLYTFLFLCMTSLAIAGGCTPPTITSNPSHKAVCENDNTYFRVIATGPSLTYQWQINQGSGFTNVLNVAPFSGATTDSLIITAVPLSLDNSVYRCIVMNGCTPNDTSSNALLKISSASSILAQPVNTTGCEGGTTTFTVLAAGTGLSYQWQVNDGSGFVNVPAAAPYSGDTLANLTITNAPMMLDGYTYQCIINAACSPTLTTNPVTLSLDSVPTITAQPSFVTACDGDMAMIMITATGNGLNYQWQLNTGSGYSNLTNGGIYSGVNTDMLDILPASYSMNGYLYRCLVNGTCSPADTSYEIPLVVYQTYFQFTNASICQGDTLVFGSSNLTSPGFYSNVFNTVNSCDSTVYLSLNVNPAYFNTMAGSICSGDSILLGTMYQSAPGTYSYVLPTINGCDSTIEYTLSLNPSYLYNSTTIICEGDSAMVFGQYETMDSLYTQNFTTFKGCDSIYTHDLIVMPNYHDTLVANICQGDSILIGGTYESVAGSFYYAYSSMYGCDSTVQTTLVVHPEYYDVKNISICSNDSIFLAGAWQNTPGVYTDSLTSAYGCDSVTVTTLSINPIPIVSLDFSSPPPPFPFYCDWDMPYTLVEGTPAGGVYSGFGVTAGVFNPGAVGTFAITYTYTDSVGCSTSIMDSITVDICEGIEEFDETNFSIYPNPFKDEFQIESEIEGAVLNIYNVLGETTFSQELTKGKTSIGMKELANGVYFIQITDGRKTFSKKLLKQ